MENNQCIFYTIYRLEKDVDVDGLHLLAGFYRFTYDLSGSDISNPCEYSSDRCGWLKCELFVSLGEFQDFFNKLNPELMRFDKEDYVETITYKGVSVPIFNDDYGQCFYCIYNNKVLGFGTFQTDYEDEVKDIIDHDMKMEVNGR